MHERMPRHTVISMKPWIPKALGPRPMAEIFTLTAVAGITLLDAWHSVEGTRAPDVITYLLVGVSIAALVVRRRLPFAVAAICMAALTVLYALGHYGELLNLPTIVALYAVAVQGTRRRTMVVGAYAMAWSALLVWIAHRTWPDFIIEAGSPTLAEMLLPAGALLLGESVRSHRELVNVYEARAVQAEGDREREALRRVEEERLRIARDLHDIVAHTVAGINVQSDVALETFDDRPELAHQVACRNDASIIEPLHSSYVSIKLVVDLPDHFLDDVLDRHDPFRPPILIDDDRDVRPVLLHLGQCLHDRKRFG